jgi:hypothetical protein
MSDYGVKVLGSGAKSFLDRLNVNEILVDPNLWGPRSAEVEEFLRNEYDPAKMPLLAAADVKTREGVWLLGWENDNTIFPPLLTYLFGPEYNEEQMARIRLMKTLPEEGESRFGFGHHRVRP